MIPTYVVVIQVFNIVIFYGFYFQLTDISDDGYLTLMADNGDLREDLKVPDGDLGESLRSDFDCGKDLLVSAILSYLSR